MTHTPSHVHQVARGAFVNLMGNLGKISHFAFDLIAARFLGQYLFGYYSTTWFTMHLVFIICYFGGHRLIIDFVAKHKDDDEKEYYKGIAAYLILSFSICFLAIIGVYVFAEDFAAYIQKPPVAEYMKIMVWSVPFYCIATILLTATRGLKIMKLWVFIRSGIEPLWDVSALCFVFFGLGFLSAPFWAKSTAYVLGAILSVYAFSKYFSIRKIFTPPTPTTWRRIMTFGPPVLFADFISAVIMKVDLIPLSIITPAATVAAFQVIQSGANIMRYIPQALDPILMPIVVEMRMKNDSSALEAIFRTIIRASLFLSFGLFTLFAVFNTFILEIFSEGFIYAAIPFTIFSFGVMLQTVCSTIEPVLVMSGFPYINLFNNIFLVTVNLIIDFWLIPTMGLMGAAIGSLTACVLTSLIQVTELYIVLKIKPLRWDLLNIFLIGILFFSTFRGAKYIMVFSWPLEITAIGIFSILYLWIGWKWFLHDEERDLFSSILTKD